MNPLDQQLQQLFRAASRARRAAPLAAPWAVENKTLAQWRSGAGREDDLFALLPLLHRAMVLAIILVLLALAFSYGELTQRAPDEVVIINSPIALTSLP